jgi:hypothetical protein
MMIGSAVKGKAIKLHLAGVGRNEIGRILNSQKMRISEATITHLIQDWKRRDQQQQQMNCSDLEPSISISTADTPPSPPQLQKQQQEAITISPSTDLCINFDSLGYCFY